MNHYVTSERFLDEHLDRYPVRAHGGNSHHAYADVSAVRVRAEGAAGPAVLLQELWERYRRPIAVTEVQLACTREEQVRWLLEVWDAASSVRDGGADIRAITSWALMGAFDWDSLLVEQRGYYESGAFDLRAPTPRPTLVAKAIQGLIQKGQFQHPALESPGWWRRPIRLTYPAVSTPATGPGTALTTTPVRSPRGDHRKVLVTGAGGTLGSAFLRLCDVRGIPAIGLRRHDLEIGDSAEVERVIRETTPWAVINCAGFARVDDAEVEQERCARENTLGAANLALTCAEHGVSFATFSSDFVFDGEQSRPHLERDQTNPLGHYGRTQRDAEERVSAIFPEALVVRTSCLFSAWDNGNFLATTLKDLDARRPVRAAPGHVVSPTYVPDLVDTTLNLLLDGEHGLWHLANHGYVTWFEWARIVAEEAGYPADEIIPALPEELGWIAPRPVFAALGSERGRLMPSWENAVERFLAATPSLRARVAA